MSNAISPRSHLATFILSLLLFCSFCGGLHRLYTGRILTGALQMVTCGGFFVWQILDIIRICNGTFTDGAGRVVERN